MMDLVFGIEGVVTFTIRNADGSISKQIRHNTETNYLKHAFVKWLTGTSNGILLPPNYIGAGNGIGTPSVNDKALWSPYSGTQRLCDYISISNTYWAQFNLTYQITDPMGPYSEFGLFDALGNLWAHVSALNLSKSSGQTITVQWMIQMVADTSNVNAIITNYMRQAFAAWITGTPNIAGVTNAIPYPQKIQLGTGSGTVASTDTALWTPNASTLKNCIAEVSGYNAVFATTYSGSDPTGSFTEIGLMDILSNLWLHGKFTASRSSGNYLSSVVNVGIN